MRYMKCVLISVVILFMSLTYGTGAERKEFTASLDQDGMQRLEVLSGSYFFDPNYIIVKVKVPVQMRIRKEGLTPHDFVLQHPDAGMDIKVGLGTDPVVVNFTPTKTGAYPFYCSKGFFFMSSHREKGMEGVLEVRE